jgi:hypothetical protein
MIDVLKSTLEVLESKAVLYCEFYGPNSDEVKELNAEIYNVNMMLLDAMVEN